MSEEETKNQKGEKPLFGVFTHISELNIESKKHLNVLNIENFRKTNIFDIKYSNINEENGCDFFSNNNKSTNPFNSNNNISSNFETSKKEIEDNNEQKSNNNKFKIENKKVNKNQNKNLLKKQKNKNNGKKRKNAKKIKNKNSSMYSILSSNNNSRSNIISKRSKSSLNSTKRSKLELKVHCSPEKYPDDYLSVDSSSDEEDKFALSNNFGKQNNNNIQNKFNYFSKIILEKEKFLETDSTKEKIEKELEGFDLMSFDLKSIFRNDDFKSKYLKNITGEIKIIYFDEYQKPLQAVFAFCDREGNFIGKEKKLFSGAYDKEEFVEFCKKMNEKKISAKVELLTDFIDMRKNGDMNFINPNTDLFIDFYFLVKIL
jgi:hypothetical protein